MKTRRDPEPVNLAAMESQPMQEIPAIRDLRKEIAEVRDQARRERRAALFALYPSEGSNLVAHAIRELELGDLLSPTSPYEGMVGESVLDMMRVFAAAGHSGYSAGLTLELFGSLARFDVLSPLTAHPAEWTEVSPGLWQSKRKPSAFWRAGEDTWYDVNDNGEITKGDEGKDR